ncbi:unnamed protein product [Mytilus edulis]|uniref:Uncharacterized protein n=1 Tax=Mytilus edulis TaxID=6550 RepID=A0A8S3Q348_MYTED|nr:unnamed protein product [Mytilus edulis]
MAEQPQSSHSLSEKNKGKMCKFQTSWISHFSWLCSSDKGPTSAYCTICCTHFSIVEGGRNDVTQHMFSSTHKEQSQIRNKTMQPVFKNNAKEDSESVSEEENKIIKAKDKVGKIESKMSKPEDEVSEKESKVTKAEEMFNNFIAENNVDSLAADHLARLCKIMFPDSQIAQKFSREYNLQN